MTQPGRAPSVAKTPPERSSRGGEPALRVMCIDAGGLRLHARCWGRERAPALLLLHGLGAHGGWWQDVASWLAERFYVVAPDLRGHGDSDASRDGDYGLPAHARDQILLARSLHLDALVLVGHSFGGAVAAEMVRTGALAVRALALFDTPIALAAEFERRLVALAASEPARFVSLENAIGAYRLLPGSARAEAALLRSVAEHSFRRGAALLWRTKTDHRAYRPPAGWNLLARLDPIRVPLLVARGSDSPVVSVEGLAAVRRCLPGADTAEIANAGHHVLLDAPHATARLIDHWLARCASNPRGQPR